MEVFVDIEISAPSDLAPVHVQETLVLPIVVFRPIFSKGDI